MQLSLKFFITLASCSWYENIYWTVRNECLNHLCFVTKTAEENLILLQRENTGNTCGWIAHVKRPLIGLIKYSPELLCTTISLKIKMLMYQLRILWLGWLKLNLLIFQETSIIIPVFHRWRRSSCIL